MKKIVFIGGGHSNTLAIRILMQKISKLELNKQNEIFNKFQFHLISEYSNSAYSGMIPGSICGYYTPKESYIDLIQFSKIHNLKFMQSSVKSINPKENKLILQDEEEFDYSLLSINIGSRTFNSGIKGVDEFTIQTRPISKLLNQIEKFELEYKQSKQSKEEYGDKIRVGIVGSGVAGLELAFSIQYRFKKRLSKDAKVTIFSNQKNIIPDLESNVVKELLNISYEKGIKVLNNSPCVKVEKNCIIYKDNNLKEKRMNFDLIIWATGSGPQELNIKANLELDNRGFILVKDTLQSINYENIFAAGDCIQIDKYITCDGTFPPKSGVYAVREGAILADNLFSYIFINQPDLLNSNDSTKLHSYIPQPIFLKLITMGDKTAFGTKFGIPFYGKWVWNLKEYIDVNFVNMLTKDISYDKFNLQSNNNEEFPFDPKECADILTNSPSEEDFSIGLKILDRLASDKKLLNNVKLILKI